MCFINYQIISDFNKVIYVMENIKIYKIIILNENYF